MLTGGKAGGKAVHFPHTFRERTQAHMPREHGFRHFMRAAVGMHGLCRAIAIGAGCPMA